MADNTMAHPGIGLGTWSWGNRFLWGYDPRQDSELEATFRAAVAAGVRLFDTADSYGTGRFDGRSESILGGCVSRLPQEERSRLCIATKLAPFPWRLGRTGFKRAFRTSRTRLGGQIDRVQLHWSTARYLPWQEQPLIDGLADLVEQGEVAELGVSNFGPVRLRELHSHLGTRGIRLVSVQVQFSLLSPQPLNSGGILDTCRELGVELLAYSPLALGLLARHSHNDLQGFTGPRRALFQRLQPSLSGLLGLMQTIADSHRSSLAAVAINWCRAHGSLPIVGMRRPAQLTEVASALEWELSAGERQELDDLALALPVRMPDNPFQSA
jgi:pyridoxine 4-dehydrogenase